jgi:hypothetical protein
MSPHPVHSFGFTATLVQIGQSNISPERLGKRYLSYPYSPILLTLLILYNQHSLQHYNRTKSDRNQPKSKTPQSHFQFILDSLSLFFRGKNRPNGSSHLLPILMKLLILNHLSSKSILYVSFCVIILAPAYLTHLVAKGCDRCPALMRILAVVQRVARFRCQRCYSQKSLPRRLAIANK